MIIRGGKMTALGFFVLLAIAVHATTSQAPGDANEVCVTSPLRPTVVNQDILMASFDYGDLVKDNGPWAVVDLDGNNDELAGSRSPIWSQSGLTCERITTACGYLSGAQDNWLITQYINNTASRDMYISVKFTINADCGLGCGTVLDMFVLQTNNSDQNFARNVSNFPSSALAALTDTVRNGLTITNEIEKIGTAATSGVYVAFRDTGTCVSIAEVVVYYPICDAHSPMVGANFSRDGLPEETLSGMCFRNMAVNMNMPGRSIQAMCVLDLGTLNTTWNMECMCVPGYRFISRSGIDQCEACPPFMFKNTLSNTDICQPCPAYSNTTESDTGVDVCPCFPGFYRAMGEDAMRCTRPPSAPRNLTISNVTNTTAVLEWEAALDDGDRSDLIYTISTNVSSANYTTSDTNFTLDTLIPFVFYEISVTAGNGVSSQDIDGRDNRTLSVFANTDEGVGGDIDQSAITGTTRELSWSPPTFPQGTIQGYEVVIRDSNNDTILQTITTGDATSLAINLEPGNYNVQIRAITAVGPGEFSAPANLTITPGDDGGGDGGSDNLGLIIGAAVGAVVVIVVIIIIIVLCVCCIQRRGGKPVDDLTMYALQNDEDITKKLPGVRKYVDPQNYASPESALKDFACEIPSHQLRLDEVIGGGEFGDVCRGIWYKPNTKHLSVAIKTLKPGSPYKDRVDFLTEASIMGQFHHDNVITLHGVVTKTQPVMIVMEYMENKSLDVYLRQNDDLLGPVRLVSMAKGVAAGMQYFGEIGFVHRDLAARNVLVSKDEMCKIADFGLSRETNDENAYDVKTGGKIPIRWTAPEAIQYRKFTTSSDVWSYGVLLWEVMSYGQQPYWDWSNHKVLDEVEAGYRLELPKDCPQTVYEVMLDCWNLDHRLRPKFDEIGKELDALLNNNFQSTRRYVRQARTNRLAPGSGNAITAGNEINPLDFPTVDMWLHAIKMDRYLETFQKNNFLEPNDCLTLTQATLIDMGITLSGHQHKILASIQAANSRLQREPSYKI
ncbi:ephrin type-B receptor 3-like isoform X2 [Dysidea avara]|uniref:ephrin type-B receptor 3-like isoform X2 n=1 Tax=Dysidea avara TaxID=196820 RepID=UPI00331A8AE9